MYPKIIKGRVRQLRSHGKTYREIQRFLKIKVPKSTLACWCYDVILPPGYKARIDELNHKNFAKAQQYAWAQIRRKRERHLENIKGAAEAILREFNVSGLKIALAMLYLGEGAKWKGHSGLMLGNSDPTVILLYITLLEKCYNIKAKQLKCRIGYRSDQSIERLEKYWSRITGIPRSSFYKTKPDPRSKGKKTRKLNYKGVCVVMCAGAHIQLELEMMARLLLERIKGR